MTFHEHPAVPMPIEGVLRFPDDDGTVDMTDLGTAEAHEHDRRLKRDPASDFDKHRAFVTWVVAMTTQNGKALVPREQ
jgi:hypothetical protein